MKIILRAAAAAAALSLAAAPAWAQSLNADAAGAYGEVALESGFTPDPHTIELEAGGSVDASTISDECWGAIAEVPDVSLDFSAGEYPLFISATSEADTTLAVRAPDGQFSCNDDWGGELNPALSWETPQSGRYQIWVGTYSPEAGTPPAALHISEVGPGATQMTERPNPGFDPAYGTVELAAGFMPDPHLQAIEAGGAFNAAGLGVEGCVGWIAQAPDYRVMWTAGEGGNPLVFSVASESDTTLVINGPDGTWRCDDDGGNIDLNPSIVYGEPASGQYDVWVGTYARGDLQPSELNVSELYSQ